MRTKLKRALFGVMAGIMVANTPLTTLAAYTPANEPDDTTGHSAETASDKEAKKDQEEKSILEQKDLYTYLGEMEEKDRKKILADLTDEQTYELVILLQYEYLNTFNQEQSLELYKETVDGYWNNIPELKTDEEKKEYESKLSEWQDTAFEYVDTEEKDQESYLKSVFKEKSYGKALYQILTEYVDEKDDAEKQAESEKAYETLKNGTFEKKDILEDSKDEKSDTTVDDKKSEETPETEKKEETVETPDQIENEQEPEQKDEQKNEQNSDSENGSDQTTADNADNSEETAEDLTLTKKELKSLMNSENFDVKKFMKREYESRNFYPIYAGIKSSKKESFLADRTPEELYQIMLMSKYTLLQQYVKYAGMTIEKSDMSDLTAYLSDYQMILEQWIGKENPLSDEQKQQLETEVLDVIAKADKLENIDSLAGYEEYLKQLDIKLDMTGLLDMFGKVDLTSEDTLSTTVGDLLNYSYQLFGMEEEMNGEEVTPKPVTSSRRKARAVMAASTTPSNGTEVAIDDGAYYITAYTSNQALQVDNNGTADQTNVCLWPTNGSGYNRCEQKWIILRQSDGWYKILSNWSRKSLDVYGGGSGNGQNVNLYTDNNSNAQRWKFYYYDGRYVIKSKVGTVVDVPNGDFSNGKNVQTWERNNSSAQQWKLTKITNDTIYLKPANSTNGHGYLASAPINNMADAYRRIQYTGGTIYVMGQWNVTSTVTLTNTSYANSAASGTTLLKGCSLSFKRYSGFKGNLIGINSSAANATFKNLTFDGNRSAVQKTVAIIAKSVGKLYLSNCTFQNNDAYNNSAAVWVYGNYSTTFDKCTFKNNKSYRDITTNSDGSGNCTSTVWIQGDSNSNGTATFNDCIFESNTDQSAVTIIGAIGYFNRCTFTKNTNTSNDGYAAAIGFNAGDGYLNGCTFDGNSASKDGGVIHVNNQKGFSHADSRGHLEAKDCIFQNNYAGNNAGVVMLWDSWQNAKFDNCQFLSNSSGGGSGSVYIGSNSQATFTNNTFSNNTAKSVGGAINEGSGYGTVSLTATGNTFTNNSCGTRGGAIYTTTKANISDNEFTGNTAGKNGGAVAVFSSSSGTTDTIKNNTFTNNSVPTTDTTNGGAVVISSGKAEFSQNIYKGNKATWGGAVDVQASGTATLINETMSDNYGKGEGGAIHNNGTMTITAGLFENNSTGDDGGGAICNTGSLTMNSDSSYDSPGVFRNNTATTFGGAVYSKDQSGSKSTKIVSNGMQYENNTAGTSGGAVAVVFKNSASKYTATLTGNTFTGNTCEGGSGGAVDIESGITGTLSNNTYESNTANRGGALYNGGTTTLSDEIMESNEVSGNGIGGAIDNEGTLTVNNGYFVNNSSDMYGGAVYNTGSLTLKKNTSGTTTGEFIDNSATDAGGAVYNKMVSQYIDCTVNSTEMTYSGNTAAYGGAVYANESTTFNSNGDTFESNKASVEGGAVNILSRGKFIMNNGSMKGNTAPKGSGVSTDGIFRMSGSAVINPDEDVYLYPSRYISVPAALTSDKVATVTPSDYTPGRVVVSNSYSEKGSVLEPKFTLTPKAGYFLRGGDKNGVNDTDVVISENYPVTYDCGTSPNPTGHFSDGTNLDDEDVKEWGVDYEIRTDKPTAKGYLFSGWNTEEDGSGDDYFPGDTYSENEALYLYAQWTPIKYTVAYNGNGSTSGSMLTQTFTYGKSYNLAANGFLRSNYHFAGWNTKADGSGTSYSDKQSVKNLATKNGAKVTLYAQWAKNTYTIRFHANGGAGSMADVTVPYDTVYYLPKNQFTLKGYQFDEWIDADHSMAIDDEGCITRTSAQSKSDVIDLYAQWTPIEYYVAYNSNKPNGATGNISGTMANSNHEYDTSNNLTANGYRLTGWTFQSWNTKADGSGTSYTDKASVKNLTTTNGGTVTLYAQWTANKYTVAYNANGGSGTMAADTATYGSGYVTKENAFSRTGYTFKGWNEKADGTGTDWTSWIGKSWTWTYTKNITLYAQWTVNKHTLTITGDSGVETITGNGTYNYGTTANVTYQIKSGYHIKNITGTTADGDPNGAWTGHTGKSGTVTDTWTVKACNRTIVVHTEPNTYTIKYDGNGNTGGSTANSSHTYDAAKALTANGYTRTGYSFNGWNTKADGSGTAYADKASVKNLTTSNGATVTLYAQWTKNSYYLDLNGWLDGKSAGNITGYGTADIYVDGVQKANDVTDFYQKIPYGSKYEIKDIKTVTGHTYVGVHSGSITGTIGTSNVGVVLEFKTNKYTVTFDKNNGTGTMTDQTFAYGVKQALTKNAFTRTGYTFAGWNTQADGKGTAYTDQQEVISLSATDGATVRLYAQWTAISYTVTYDGNGNTGGSTASSSHKYDTAKTLTANGFTKTGYTFKGWNTKADGSGTSYADKASVKNLSSTNGATVTLYAQWTVNKYTVTYNANGGTGTMATDTVSYGTGYVTKTNAFTRTGYTFKGWNEKADGTGTDWTSWIGKSWTWTYTKNITLYAQWTINQYSLIVNPNGGVYNGTSSNTTKTVDYGTKQEVNGLPTRDGYTFQGWNRTGSGSLHSGQASEKSSMITMTEKADTDGTAYTKYTMNYTNSGTGTVYPNLAFFYYPYESGHTYRLSYDVRVNSASGLAYSTMRHSGFRNNWTATSDSLNKTTSGWEHRSMERTFTGTTINQSGTNHTINPMVEFYAAIYAGNTGVFDFDLKNLTVYDVTAGKYVESKTTTVKNGATVDMGAGNTTLTAVWKANNYTIKYNGNGNTGGSTANSSHTYNVEKSLTANGYTRTGYTFKNWNTKADGSGVTYTDKQVVKNLSKTSGDTITLYAQWTANQYQLTLNPNNGSFTDGKTTAKTLSPNLIYNGDNWWDISSQKVSRTGYTFDGWYDKASGGEKVYDANGSCVTGTYWKNGKYQYTGNLTVYAHWTAKSVTVTFHRNVDSNDTTTAQQTFTYDVAGQKFSDKNWNKTGYTLIGWSENKDATTATYSKNSGVSNEWINGKSPKTDLYAVWKANSYTVKYDGNGSTGGSTASSSHTYDTAKALTANGYTRTGYSFNGWNTKANGSGTAYADKASVKNLTATDGATVTLYAQWAANKYTVTYDANGGTGAPAAQVFTYNAGEKFSNTKPARTGYTFVGWKVGTTIYNPADTIPNGTMNLTLKAMWVVNSYRVTFDGNGNTSGTTADEYFTYDESKALTANGFIKKGYNFSKWTTAKDGTGTSYSDKQTVSKLANGENKNISYKGWSPASNKAGAAGNGAKDNGWVEDDSLTTGLARKITYSVAGDGGVYSYPLGTDAATMNKLAGKVITVTFKAKASVVMDLGTVGLERVSTQKISLGTNWNTYRITGTVPENWGDSYKAMVFYKPSVAGTVYIGDLSVSIPGAVKMYAQWNAKQYQLTLNPNSGNFADGTTTAKTLESKLVYGTGNCWSISSYAVAKTGYTLDGWYDKASGGEKVYTADGTCVDGTYWKNKTYQYDGNLTVYAHWTANKYTVAYNANGGSGTMATDTVTYGTGYVTKANAFTKNGYTFVGWNEKADGSGTDWTNWIGKSWTWTYTKNITLYAQWKINQYTLTITGDSGVEKITGSGTYNYGTIANVTYQIKPGYHIKNITGTTADGDPNGVWTGHTGKGGTVNDTWTVKACNRTAVVHTEPNTYTIKYDGNGSTGGSTASSSHTYDTAKALTANGYTRTGYSFNGWNTKADGSGTAYADNASVKNLTTANGGMVTLYAQWTKNSYYLDLNGWLDGKSAGNITGYGTADIYVDGVQKANDVTDFYQKIPYGSKYEIKDIKTVTGHTYVGVHSGSITGTIGISNVGVVLEFKTNKYTVTFDKNNGTGTMTDQTFTYGVKQALTKNAFTRTGYTFTGWNTKADGSGTAYTDKQEVTSLTAKDGATIMLYAQWKINSYMLTYNPNGGTVTPTSKTLTYGSTYGALPTPSRTGYTFTGWFTAASGGSKVGTTTTMGAGNTTVYAHWRANILTVNYYPNGATKVDTSSAADGTAVSTIDSSAKYRSDAFGYDASLPSYGLWDAQRFIRTGYTSTNKYHANSATGTILLDAGNHVYAKTQDLASAVGKLTALETGDVTLNIYADWKANTYKIVYNGNGNTGGSTASGSHTYDTAKTLTANGFTKTGYTFKNWNTKADGSGTSYAEKASVKNLTSTNGGTVTLYAQWIANTYTVTYNANGGTGTMANQEMTYDKAATLNANAFKRTGYRFNGWNTKADGTGNSYADKASVKNLTATSGGTVTLYAKWYSAAPELEAKDATYYEGQEITKATLLKNVTKASDAEDGDMTGKVMITKIEYAAGKLVDGKSQAAYTRSWPNGMPDSEKLDTWFLQLPKEKAPVTHKITYQVTDLSGKTTTKTSTITVKYNEFPVMKAEDRYFTLEDAKAGKITQDVLLKDAITSDKLKATDAEDGTISNRITIVDYKDTDFKNVNGNTVVRVTFKVKDSMGKEAIQEIKVNVIDSGSDYWRDDDEAVRKQVRFITQKYYDKNKDTDFHGMTSEEIEASSDNGGLNVMSKWYQNAAYKALLTGSFTKDAGTDYKISAEKAKELKQKIESNGIGNSKSSNALTDIYNSLK